MLTSVSLVYLLDYLQPSGEFIKIFNKFRLNNIGIMSPSLKIEESYLGYLFDYKDLLDFVDKDNYLMNKFNEKVKEFYSSFRKTDKVSLSNTINFIIRLSYCMLVGNGIINKESRTSYIFQERSIHLSFDNELDLETDSIRCTAEIFYILRDILVILYKVNNYFFSPEFMIMGDLLKFCNCDMNLKHLGKCGNFVTKKYRELSKWSINVDFSIIRLKDYFDYNNIKYKLKDEDELCGAGSGCISLNIETNNKIVFVHRNPLHKINYCIIKNNTIHVYNNIIVYKQNKKIRKIEIGTIEDTILILKTLYNII